MLDLTKSHGSQRLKYPLPARPVPGVVKTDIRNRADSGYPLTDPTVLFGERFENGESRKGRETSRVFGS